MLVACIAAPFLANTAGWIFTEMGRQPWIVYGLMKTGRADSPSVSATDVAVTLGGFVLLYTVLGVIDVVLMCLVGPARAGRRRTPRPPGGRRPGERGAGTHLLRRRAVSGPVASLNTAWFALIGVLWTGYFVLEGFDFGVGMLSLAIGRDDIDRRMCPERHRPVLGRQRGVADRRGRRHLRRLPASGTPACSAASTSRCSSCWPR